MRPVYHTPTGIPRFPHSNPGTPSYTPPDSPDERELSTRSYTPPDEAELLELLEPDAEPVANEPDATEPDATEPDWTLEMIAPPDKKLIENKPAAIMNKPGQGSAIENKPGKGPAIKNKPGQGSATKHKPGKGPAIENKPGQGTAIKPGTQFSKRAFQAGLGR